MSIVQGAARRTLRRSTHTVHESRGETPSTDAENLKSATAREHLVGSRHIVTHMIFHLKSKSEVISAREIHTLSLPHLR